MNTVKKKKSASKKSVKAKKPKKLTRREMRIVIAKDALKQLKAKKYRSVRGIYGSSDDSIVPKDRLFGSEQLQPFLLAKDAPACEVCAKGGLLLSAVRKFDNLQAYRATDSNGTLNLSEHTCSENLLPYFTQQELDHYEKLFENSGGSPTAVLQCILKSIVEEKPIKACRGADGRYRFNGKTFVQPPKEGS